MPGDTIKTIIVLMISIHIYNVSTFPAPSKNKTNKSVFILEQIHS